MIKEFKETLFNKDYDIAQEMKYDEDFGMYTDLKGEVKPIFFNNSRKLKDVQVYDQYILIGHYLLSMNKEINSKYKEEMGKYLIMDKGITRNFLINDLFNIFLYGKITATYIKNMPDTPYFYFERLRDGETNNCLRNYLAEEHKNGNKTAINTIGGPYYNYSKRDSMVMNGGNIIICPVSSMVPDLKEQANILYNFTNELYTRLYDKKIEGFAEFVSLFHTDKWKDYFVYY